MFNSIYVVLLAFAVGALMMPRRSDLRAVPVVI